MFSVQLFFFRHIQFDLVIVFHMNTTSLLFKDGVMSGHC